MTASNELSFLPENYLERRYLRRVHVACGVILALAAGGILVSWKMLHTNNARVEAAFADVDARYIDAARKIEQVKRMHEKQRDVFRHAELAASLVEKVPRSNILAKITNSLPGGVSLLDLTLHSTPRAAEASSSSAAHKTDADAQAKPQQFDVRMTITGIAPDDVQVAQLMTNLGKCPLFQNVNLVISDNYNDPQSPNRPGVKAQTLRQWQIEMGLNPQAEVTPEQTRNAALELSK